jgi:hypothetical protein
MWGKVNFFKTVVFWGAFFGPNGGFFGHDSI